MSRASLMLGSSTIFLTTIGALISLKATKEWLPPAHSRADAGAISFRAPKDDQLPLAAVANKIEPPHDAFAEDKQYVYRLCTTLDSKLFAWNWPNVPFATMACEPPRRKMKDPEH